MTREEHIKLAQQAFIYKGFWPNEVMWECWKDAWLAGVAAERERCARVCEEVLHPDESAKIEADWYAGTWACAAAIRKGGE